MIEKTLLRLAEHPRGRLFVIILSFGIGLLLIWPLADEYTALTEESEKLAAEVDETRRAAETLDQFAARVATVAAGLEELESRTVSEQEISDFRGQIVALARQSGCQVRRINIGTGKSRSWMTEDHALEPTAVKKPTNKESEFDLKSQSFALTISGSLPNVQNFLKVLHGRQCLAHTKTLSLRPEGSNRQEIVLELELWLFDLVKRKGVPA